MNILNSLATGFTAALGSNSEANNAAPDAGSGDRMFSKWMDNASSQQQRTAQTQKSAQQPPRERVGERKGRQPDQQPEARAPKATEGNRAAAEAEQASQTASADKPADRERKDEQDSPAQDGAWPPPGLVALLMPALPPTTAPGVPTEGALPQGDALTASQGTPSALPTTLAALMAQASAPQAAGGDSATVAGDPQAALALPTDAAATQSPAGQPANAAAGATPAGAFALNALPVAAKPEALPADMAAMVAALSPDAKAAAEVADAGADTRIGEVRAAISLTQPAPLAAARDVAVVAPPSVVPNLQGEAFADEIGTHLKWMADQKVGHAHLRVSPDDMGTVDIRLKLDGDRVSADFSAAQGEVRQALEQSLPRLRELLGQHGFQLAHADVGHRQQPRQDSDGTARMAAPGGSVDLPEDGAMTTVSVRSLRGRGLLDAYA